jgi:hypothetical protein
MRITVRKHRLTPRQRRLLSFIAIPHEERAAVARAAGRPAAAVLLRRDDGWALWVWAVQNGYISKVWGQIAQPIQASEKALAALHRHYRQASKNRRRR